MGNYELALCSKCIDCPEFDSETRKEILHGDTIFAEVNIQITCKHRGLCDRIEEHLKEVLHAEHENICGAGSSSHGNKPE